MNDAKLLLGDAPLTLARLEPCIERPTPVCISQTARERVGRGRKWLDALARRGDAIYGINTGFGHLKNKRIASDQLDELQQNLLLSHAVGVGPPTPPEIVRIMLLIKTHMLLAGHSGVRPELIDMLAAWLNHDLLPVVPSRGSLGASGDLAPLAHLFLPLIGRGAMLHRVAPDNVRQTLETVNGADRGWEELPAAAALARYGLSPLRLAAKEGLALINGTQFMAAYGANIAIRAGRLLDLADLICCMSLEGCRGTVRHVDARLHALRPHPGAQQTAANIRRHMAGSEILTSHADCGRVQDPYSLRCAPQVHGAVRDASAHFAQTIDRELNSVTDNPILFENDAISGGNFHGEPLALSLDYMAMALTELGNISERRVYLLLAGDDKLPKLLMRDTGLNSGFMIPQYTAAALLNECKTLSTPASVDSIPTSLGQEDHVSMGATSALKCYEILDRVEHILAIELLCAAQAIDYHLPLRPGVGPAAAHALVRETIDHAERDRQFGEDILAALLLLRSEPRLLAAARGWA